MSKNSQKIPLTLILLLLSCSWNLQALAGKNSRVVNNRSDSIILPPLLEGEIKYVRPDPRVGFGDDRRYHTPDMEPRKGFLVKSTNPATYSLNFPTTGADKLYFDLYIEGIGVDELIWEPVSHEGITASMELIKRGDHRWVYHWSEREILDNNDVTLIRVTLTGPNDFSQRHNPYPSRITVPRLPQTFELVGKDSYGQAIIKYGFVLQKWFVNRAHGTHTRHLQETWCNNIGYRLARIKDLTNAVCEEPRGVAPRYCGSVVSATPSSNFEYADRRIGAGILGEWGDLSDYRWSNCTNIHDSECIWIFTWVSDFHPDIRDSQGFVFHYSYYVNIWSGTGAIMNYIDLNADQGYPDNGRGFGALCVTP